MLRTSVAAHALPSADVVRAYKNLAHLERDFGSLKTIDLDLRPIRHYTADRVRAHVWLCALAAYLVWHLRRDLAPLTFTDETPPTGADPVAPACRSAAADRKASRQTHDDGAPVYSFRGLLDHLATLTRNTLRFPSAPRRPHRRAARRPHPHPTARLPAPRHRRPAPAHVDTTTPSAVPDPPCQRGRLTSRSRNFGLGALTARMATLADVPADVAMGGSLPAMIAAILIACRRLAPAPCVLACLHP